MFPPGRSPGRGLLVGFHHGKVNRWPSCRRLSRTGSSSVSANFGVILGGRPLRRSPCNSVGPLLIEATAAGVMYERPELAEASAVRASLSMSQDTARGRGLARSHAPRRTACSPYTISPTWRRVERSDTSWSNKGNSTLSRAAKRVLISAR